jgi:hypothetical protein
MTTGTTTQNLRLVQQTLEERFGRDSLIDNIRVDGGQEFGRIGSDVPLGIHTFNQNELSSYLHPLGIKLCMFPSIFTNKNRIIDRAILTIRDMLGEDNSLFFWPDIVSEAVELHNNRLYQAFNYEFTPAEVQSHKALEECFIRDNINRAQEMHKKQEAAGFFMYRSGNILLIHIDMTKAHILRTSKRRATFNRLAEFIGYEHGNVCCKVLEKQITEGISLFWKRPIVIPIYYTKYVCATLADLPFTFRTLIF